MSESNTSSKLGHTQATDSSSSASAQNFSGAPAGNTSSAAGVNNPATGGSAKREDGAAQEVAGTLSSNFTLANTKAESKGEDKTSTNMSTANEGEPLSTAGPGGDSQVHKPAQAHDYDMPQTEDRSRPREIIGDNAKTQHNKA